MSAFQTDFEKQVIQIASLGVWQIVTGRPMNKRLEPVDDDRWNLKTGIFVTLKVGDQVRGSMGLLESTTILPETLFNAGQTAATHDQRFAPITEAEFDKLEIEVTLLSVFEKMKTVADIEIGTTGLFVARGDKQALLLPQVPVDYGWNAEQFLEACCEKAQLSHKAWKDANTMVECFHSHTLLGGNLVATIREFV